jgi:hypothetical protein
MCPKPIAIACLLAGLGFVPGTRAGDAGERLHALKERLRGIEALEKRLGPERARVLSSGAQNLLQLSHLIDRLHPGEGPVTPTRVADRMESGLLPESHSGRVQVRPVSESRTDFILSQQSGFSQSETSTAWCGDTAVVGFNDSGSLWETLTGTAGLSFNGVARSTNRGARFVDLGFLNPGPDFNNQLGGDPVVACSSEHDFAYASLFFFGAFPNLQTAISVSRSSDGGASFDDPAAAVSKPYLALVGGNLVSLHFLDKPWFAVSLVDPLKMYVTYTDFDSSGTSPGCGAQERTAIELVRSTDGGATWSAPLVLDEVCGPGPVVQGSQVLVGSEGEVYVAWEHFDDFVTRDLRFARSTDGGATFGPTRLVSSVSCVGDCFGLKGGFRSGFEFPSLAVDRSSRPTQGSLYVAWHDGRRVRVPDIESPTGFYGFADVLVSRSGDGGDTWLPPVQVNGFDARTDQFQPGIAVDAEGLVGACYYDRQLDLANFFIRRACAVSRDAGQSWVERRLGGRSWAPFHATDAVLNPYYMGDYDGLASDSTPSWRGRGFLGAFSRQDARGNPDVFSNRIRP